jgi:CheY-like chemotaxis protein
LNVVWKKVPKGLLKKKEEKEQEAHVGHKILVAEDNPINQKLIITILEQAGYQVTAADNGQIAVDLYMNDKYDLVLMDIDMPVMDGITANRLIKEIDDKDNRPFTPVVALTARAMAGDRERIIGAGLDAHLSKPVDREFLLQTIDRFLKMKEQRNLVK